MYNTIRLLKGEESLTRNEYKKFRKGDTIYGNDSDPEEVKRWNIEQDQEAKEELSKLSCTYKEHTESWSIREYALEYCEYDENGEFVEGSDFDLAEEAVENVD